MKINKSKNDKISFLCSILYPLKKSFFWCFQWIQNGNMGEKWVKQHSISLRLKKLCKAKLKRNERTFKQKNFKQKYLQYSVNIKSSVKVLKFYGRKLWNAVTSLSQLKLFATHTSFTITLIYHTQWQWLGYIMSVYRFTMCYNHSLILCSHVIIV